MTREEANSFFDEAMSLPNRMGSDLSPFKIGDGVKGYGSSAPDEHFAMTKLVQKWNPDTRQVESIRKKTTAGTYLTQTDVLTFPALGVETVRGAAAGLWHANFCNHLQAGCRRRDATGRRYILTEETNPLPMNVGEGAMWTPSCQEMHFTKWENKVYTFKNLTFTEDNTEREVATVVGENQFVKVQDLDDFLKVGYINSIWRNRPFGVEQVENQVKNQVEVFRQTSIMPSNGGARETTGALNLQYESIQFQTDGYMRLVESGGIPHTISWLTSDSATPRATTVRVVFEDNSGQSLEAFTETVSFIGGFMQFGIHYEYDEFARLQTFLFMPPVQMRTFMSTYGDWYYKNAYKNKLFQEGKTTSTKYTEAVAEADSLYEACTNMIYESEHVGKLPRTDWYLDQVAETMTPLFHVERNSTPMFLKKGVEYKMRVEVDTLYTPLTLRKIPTVQNRANYKSVRVG